ncbi:hypothetical protein N7447_010911 [Penicillium robsamsonii]|uniref:uncharacterized protein n=1 Tax=Penicillium robsamsonii TaxID=1792511 RepID=UPI0025469AA5|nr:uncharacterized protein N7447_010911 [Penicillium robsamsonii]KAJ5807455.1 hypothetical protein N7447_010911 [Penicillium robsamsonii]
MAEHLFFPGEPPCPYLVEYKSSLYDGSDWDQFPIRAGWRLETGFETHWPVILMPSKFHSQIECWLYFGMLHYVFGDQLDQSDFLLRREGDSRQYLTTKHLHKYIGNAKEWKRRKLGERAVYIVKTVCVNLSAYADVCVREKMVVAIRLVCNVLWNVAVKRDGFQMQTASVQNWLSARDTETKQMIAAGWCPLEAEKCRWTGGGLDTAVYLLQLRRVKANWNRDKSHFGCTKTECVANNVDESDYVTRHVQENCTCSHLQANIEQLHTILQDGGVPLLMITPCGEDDLGNEKFEIEIVRKRIGKQYLAISHVWSDGLGNTEGNSLPHCQLKALYEQAKSVLTGDEYVPRYSNGPFGSLHTSTGRLAHLLSNQVLRRDDSVLLWIDTLCIPHQPDVRSLAIQRIRELYIDAYRTMIIDSEMKNVDASSATHLEFLLRILYCSGWIRRLWTLQEGLAAKSRLYVLFSDKVVNISTIADELLTKLDGGKLPLMQERITTFAIGVWFSFFQLTVESTSKFNRFVDFVVAPIYERDHSKSGLIASNWFNVATRATSKAADRPIILAGILNLDLKEILSVKGSDERMRKFYSLIDDFPADVVFQHGPRFEEDGMRWALKVCQFTNKLGYLSAGAGKITPRGLHITSYPSWLFPSDMVFDLDRDAFSINSDGTPAWNQWADDHNIESGKIKDVCHLKTETPCIFESNGTYGIIVARDREGYPKTSNKECAVVSLRTTEDGVHYAEHISSGTFKSVTGHKDEPYDGYMVAVIWDDRQKLDWVVG